MCLKGQKIEDIKEVYSHPMALLQCANFFENHPHIKLIEDKDTAEVARRIHKNKLKGIVLDLRNNGGGSLQTVIDMAGLFIKDGPIVQVRATGEPKEVLKDKDKVVVERINMVKRHTKPSEMNQQGQIVDKEAPIHVSNIQLICPECTKTGRIGRKRLEDGTKVRWCKHCTESIESKS